ncbi:fructose-bisphosphate aldolase [Peribacillus simplex]|uniref:fructose-bisphosphate aldolase n=1 Tax=Peribacillus simplex TaxID=1478 RepID=UPI0037F74BE4
MRKYQQICIPFLFLPLILISFVGCNNIQEPNITIEAQISKLSKKEFNTIGTQGYDNPIKNDFRKFTFNLYMEHTDQITSRTIDIPNDLEKLINTVDRERYLYGNGNEKDNKNENFAKYTKEFVFYSKGLSEDEIKKAFDSAIITVSWVTKEGKTITKEFVIGDLIKLNN